MMVNPSMVKPLGLSSERDEFEQAAGGHEAALGDVALPDDLLRGVGHGTVGIAVEVAHHAVHLQHLVDVPGDDAVVVPLLREVRIVVVHAFVRQQQGTLHVVFYRALFGREREEQLVETAHMFPCLRRTVLREVLRECQHQRLAVIQHINLLPSVSPRSGRNSTRSIPSPRRTARGRRYRTGVSA